ncbi:MAG: UDP-N-acetyl glucosamine 2-epimerase, partial [Bacteroidetes bacterium]|nr:UDP-N-acetyl glucosamine 2-epimerase [Bacteroidota bacterium]
LLVRDEFILCTIHRAENTDDPKRIAGIINALNEITQDMQIILPLHPRTEKILTASNIDTKNITIIKPVGYLNMIWLLDHCSMIMTDSGGLQKEAFFFEKPCITLRYETEWIELVEHGFNVLVGAEEEKIKDAYYNSKFSSNFEMDLYGNGKASKRIVEALESA